jgi:hypothetical protein
LFALFRLLREPLTADQTTLPLAHLWPEADHCPDA